MRLIDPKHSQLWCVHRSWRRSLCERPLCSSGQCFPFFNTPQWKILAVLSCYLVEPQLWAHLNNSRGTNISSNYLFGGWGINSICIIWAALQLACAIKSYRSNFAHIISPLKEQRQKSTQHLLAQLNPRTLLGATVCRWCPLGEIYPVLGFFWEAIKNLWLYWSNDLLARQQYDPQDCLCFHSGAVEL